MVVTTVRLTIVTLFVFICLTCIASANFANKEWKLTVVGDATTKNVISANTTFLQNDEEQTAFCAIFNGKDRVLTCNKTTSNHSVDQIYVSISYTKETNNKLPNCVKAEDTTTSSPATTEAGNILATAVLLLANSIVINITGCWCRTKVFRRMDLNKNPLSQRPTR
ncbi:Hypothetical predicted protein [Cloeon dipterum]|uniref:Uncharacterized protein n=1 Tax=Cloeon dipterum TaxID=197152 RepID=A0A8S1DEH0_9INSE|nr:Hypothetical predicted protein [Cloeon dipterum]